MVSKVFIHRRGSLLGALQSLKTVSPTILEHMKLNRLFASNILRYLGFIWQSSPKWSIASILLVALQGVLPLVTLYLIKLAVDSVVRFHGYDTIFGFNSVVFFIVLLGIATVLEAVSSSTDRIVSLIQGNLLTERMYDMLHAKSAEVDLKYLLRDKYRLNGQIDA
jgi:ATP-binding cassette subfamily B protein